MNSRRLSAWQCVIIVRQNCEKSAAWDLKMDSSLKNKTIKKKQKFMNIILINWLKVAIQKYFWMLNIYFMSLTGTSTLKNHYDSNPVKVLIWVQLCHKFHIIFRNPITVTTGLTSTACSSFITKIVIHLHFYIALHLHNFIWPCWSDRAWSWVVEEREGRRGRAGSVTQQGGVRVSVHLQRCNLYEKLTKSLL